MHKIKDGEEIIAVISLNNMIPVTENLVSLIDFNQIADKKYVNLMQKEIHYIKSTQDELKKKADFLYKQICFVKNERYLNLCCNFPLLEQVCEQYQANKS